MSKKCIYLMSVLVLSVISTGYADVVIGDWENSSYDGWIDWGTVQAIEAPKYTFSETGATLGSSALCMSPGSGWQQNLSVKLADIGMLDAFKAGTAFAIDVTYNSGDWDPNTTYAGTYTLSLNAEGYGWNDVGGSKSPEGENGVIFTDTLNPDSPGNLPLIDPGTPGTTLTGTWTWDYSGILDAIPDATYVEFIIATNSDQAGAYYFDNARIIGAEPPEPVPTAAMVVSDPNLPNGLDQAQKDRLESLGYEVTLATGSDVSDGVFTAADAETFDVLVVSESIGSSAANNLIGANVPMMHQESFGWSRHFFTHGLGKTWLNDPAGEVNIVDDAHQIVTDAGLAAGQVAFFTDPNIAWTTDTVESLVAGAVNIAQIANADGVAYTIIFTIEAGTELADPNMVAANRVCCFSLPGQDLLAADVMTDDAWALFDAAIAWLNPPPPPSAAMIVSDVNLPAGLDLAQYDRLVALGYEVTLATGDDVSNGVFTPADAETFDVLVVSESIGSSAANNLIGANVPMMHQESFGWSRHFFTLGLGKTWLNDPAGEVNIVNENHPISAGANLAGQVAFFTDPTIAWTTDTVESLVAGAVNIAQIANADGVAHTIIFAIEAGTELADPNMVAANRVCGFSLPGQGLLAADVMTDDAWALFDSAIAWLDRPQPVITVGPIDSMTATGDKGIILSINGIDANDMITGTSTYADPSAASRDAELGDDFDLDTLASADSQASMQTVFDQAVDTIFLVEFRGDDSGYFQPLDAMGDPVGGMVPFGPDDFADTGYLAHADQVSKALVIQSEVPIYGIKLIAIKSMADYGLGFDPLCIVAVPAP